MAFHGVVGVGDQSGAEYLVLATESGSWNLNFDKNGVTAITDLFRARLIGPGPENGTRIDATFHITYVDGAYHAQFGNFVVTCGAG